jgi:hypothetical protein
LLKRCVRGWCRYKDVPPADAPDALEVTEALLAAVKAKL